MKQEEKIKYNGELLDKTIARDSATLIGEYEKLNREKRIQFICKCGKEGEKTFRLMESKGTLCKECSRELKIKNTKETIIKIYGVDNLMLCDAIKNKVKATNLEKYGAEIALKNKEIKEKARQTIINKYGVDETFKSEIIKNKCKETMLNRYGVINAFENEDIKKKIKERNLELYGVEHASQRNDVKEKRIETSMRKYGVKHHLQLKEIMQKQINTNVKKYNINHYFNLPSVKQNIRDNFKINKYKNNIIHKRRISCFNKYGVLHHLQNPIILEKCENSYRHKSYKMPSGTIRKVQGYEPFAIDELLQTYKEEQILTGARNVPRIKYNLNDKEHYYFPDIYIPHENKVIEVKSPWTYNKYLEINKAKANKCIAEGYNFEIWMYDGKNKEKTIITSFD